MSRLSTRRRERPDRTVPNLSTSSGSMADKLQRAAASLGFSGSSNMDVEDERDKEAYLQLWVPSLQLKATHRPISLATETKLNVCFLWQVTLFLKRSQQNCTVPKNDSPLAITTVQGNMIESQRPYWHWQTSGL